MATYLIKCEYELTRQEGDDCGVNFVVPVAFALDSNAVCTLSVNGNVHGSNELIFSIAGVVTGQNISFTIDSSLTSGKHGTHRWQLTIDQLGLTTTVGRGNFIIEKSII